MSLTHKVSEVLAPSLVNITGTLTTVVAGSAGLFQPGKADVSIYQPQTTAWVGVIALQRNFTTTTLTYTTGWVTMTTHSANYEGTVDLGSQAMLRVTSTSWTSGTAGYRLRQGS